MLDHIVLTGVNAAFAARMKQAGETKPRPPSHYELSAELALVSDYRRAGVSRSDDHPAVQGRVDLRLDSGWSAGVSASSIHSRRGSNAEVSLFGARRIDLGNTDISLGASAVMFIGGDADPFAVAQASVSHPIGPIEATLAVSYAPAQDALNNSHGLYVVLRARTPLGRLNGAPVTAAASVGWSEGEFAMGAETKLDWSVGVTTELAGVELGLAYVDNDLSDHRGEAGLVFSIARDF